ncbi:hypothetical protein PRZ48_007202 [Zasmidium cellare]|uniref:BTB domain-containing protein n=1 Tax=Zasmidium cellare TaxID=395010 RepID=A0ABR0EJL4_ZASCE|nr:hypothetical protein PRZ48_007202 [Zasmidium cellare]
MAGALIRKQDAVAARQATKRFYFTDHVTVIVGRGRHEKSFMAHADVLSKSCLFFEEACISSAEEEKILLPEVEDHRTFNYFLQWAYTGKIVFLGMDDLGELKYVVHCLKFAIHLYEFGIQLRSIALRNAAVDTFLDVLSSAKRIPQAAIVAQLWSSTPPGCKLQQLVLNWGVHHLQASWLEQHRPRLPDAFLADLSINFARQNEDPFQTLASDPLITQKHHYHEGIIGRSHCDYTLEPISIAVGPTPKIFNLNPTILATNSKFFLKALSSTWTPFQKTATFNLTTIDVATFNHYANWCHHGNLNLIVEHLSEDKLFELLTNLYILADVLDDKPLRNAIMDHILLSPTHLPDASTITLAFANLPETSSLCRYLIDEALSGTTHPEWLKENINELPTGYVDALLFGWAKGAFEKGAVREHPGVIVKVAPCTYHEHDGEVLPGEGCKGVEMVMKGKAKSALVRRKKGVRMLDLA